MRGFFEWLGAISGCFIWGITAIGLLLSAILAVLMFGTSSIWVVGLVIYGGIYALSHTIARWRGK